MKKLIVIIALLIILIYFSYRYLKNTASERESYLFSLNSKPLLYLKKELLLDNKEEFEFEEFFNIISNNKCQYKYEFTDDQIIVFINDNKYSYPYKIKEKEVITEYIYEEIYIERPVQIQSETIHSSEDQNSSFDYEEEYLYLGSDYFEFNNGTDLGIIINSIQSSIDTNQRIYIDYSSLNPNDPGLYQVDVVSDKQTYNIQIKII